MITADARRSSTVRGPRNSRSAISRRDRRPRLPPFGFGALRRKKRRGTATLIVILPSPGRLVLAGRGVKRRSFEAPEGTVKLRIHPKPGACQKLDETGSARVRANITHTPDGGAPGTQTKQIKLIQRP